jgi:hypothetical protein
MCITVMLCTTNATKAPQFPLDSTVTGLPLNRGVPHVSTMELLQAPCVVTDRAPVRSAASRLSHVSRSAGRA